METGTTWYTCGTKIHRTGHAEESKLYVQEIRILRGSKFRVQREFRRKYPEYGYCIASGSDIDLVADVEVMDTTEEGISQ